jgi:methenyltetrahydrofolate cyclohydrolase
LRPANPLRVESLDEYLARLASRDPVPGGGSAATVVAALGAALVTMVARIGKAETLAQEADALRARLDEARARDEAAFAAVVAAQALPKNNESEKSARWHALETALYEAAEAPLHAAILSSAVLNLSERAYRASSAALVSDAGCAAEFAYAALLACAYNVRINHRYMKDATAIARQASQLADCEAAATATLLRLRSELREALSEPK